MEEANKTLGGVLEVYEVVRFLIRIDPHDVCSSVREEIFVLL